MGKSLKKYSIEFIVIFISITLSFFVEEWRTNRQQKQITIEFLKRLRNEIETLSIGSKIFLEGNRTSSRGFKIIYQNFSYRNINQDSLVKICVKSQTFSAFKPTITTWESIINSGNINNLNLSIIDSVSSLLKCYREIEIMNDLTIKFGSELFTSISKDFPASKYLNSMNEMNHLDFRVKNNKNEIFAMDKFLSNNTAMDYYSAMFNLTNYIDLKYYKTLNEKEKRLIDLINNEIK